MIASCPRPLRAAGETIREPGKDPTMRRTLHLATAALAALTALALLGAAATIRLPGPPAAAEPPEEANRALVARFYAAANAAIATGETEPLRALIDPGFVERGHPAGTVADREGVIRRLLAIAATDADVRLTIDATAAAGDLVIASVQLDGAVAPNHAGLTLDGAWTPWGPLDVFRIARGRIVERWGSVPDPAPIALVLRVALDAPPPPRTLAVARVALEPGASHGLPAGSGVRLVLVETGAITAGAPPAAPETQPPTRLRAGEHLILPTGRGVVVRNRGAATASLLHVAIAPPPAANSSPPAEAPGQGVVVDPLAGDTWITVPGRTVVLSVGRATLEPGERLAWRAPAGPVLLHVESGTVELAATGPVPWLRSGAVVRSKGGVAGRLDAGGGALLEGGAAAEVRAVAASTLAATVLIVTLGPGPEAAPRSRAAIASRPAEATAPGDGVGHDGARRIARRHVRARSGPGGARGIPGRARITIQ